jgi:hypothetical protein
LHVAGNARVGADDVTDAVLEIGAGASGNRTSYIDIVGDTTYTDYGLRVIRNNTGANATSELKHRGTGALNFTTEEAAPIVFNTTNSPALTITSGGLVGIGSSNPQALLHISSATTATERISGTAGNSDNTECANIDFQNNTSGSVVGRIRSLTGVGGIQSGKGQLAFFAHNGTSLLERVRINEDGLVGIGTTSPAQKLEIQNGSISIGSSSNDNATNVLVAGYGYILSGTKYGNTSIRSTYSNANNAASLEFYVASSGANTDERMRLDSSGRLLVGTSTARSSINILNQTDLTPSVQFEGQSTSNRSTGLSIINYSASDFGPAFTLGASNSNILGTNTLVESDGDVGVINFVGADGTRFVSCASIAAEVDGTPGVNDMPGRLVFSTTADEASSPTERMRITSYGTFLASNAGSYPTTTGTYHAFSANSPDDLILRLNNTSSTNPYGVNVVFDAAAPNDTTRFFLNCADNAALRATIRSNGGLANYSANNANLSDRNVKKDISPAANTWNCIKEWEIVNYRYKDQPDDADLNLGVIAQQVAESCPEVITIFQEAKEATEDKPAQEERLGVKEQQMYWMAIKALQEAMGRIEQLETKVAALESA